MALTKCKECGGQVSTIADACPSCGAKVRARTDPKAAAGGCLTLVLLAAGIAWGLDSCSPDTKDQGTKSPSEQAQEAASNAFYMCESFIKDQLRDPDTAQFMTDFSPDLVTKTADSHFHTIIRLRAANGLGGKTISLFSCETHPVPGDKWVRDDLEEQNADTSP